MLSNNNGIFRLLAFVFTCFNGLAGLLGIYFVVIGDAFWPLRLIIIGAGFDFLDGYFARKTQQYSPIGAYLDSVADAITYVLVPSFILVFSGQNRQPDTIYDLATLIIAFFYFCCGVYRLIRFVKSPPGIYFEGLPASIAALIVGSLYVLIMTNPPEFRFFFTRGIHISFIIIGLSFLMITRLKYPSHISYSQFHKVFRVIGYIVISLYVIFSNFWTSLGVFLFFLYYTLAGPYYMRTELKSSYP